MTDGDAATGVDKVTADASVAWGLIAGAVALSGPHAAIRAMNNAALAIHPPIFRGIGFIRSPLSTSVPWRDLNLRCHIPAKTFIDTIRSNNDGVKRHIAVLTSSQRPDAGHLARDFEVWQ